MLKRSAIVLTCLAALFGVPTPSEAVDLTGCSYSRTQKVSATYERGTIRIGPATRGVSETVTVNCTVRYGDPEGPVMGTIGGSLDITVAGNGATLSGPVGLVIKDVFMNYAPLGVVPQTGTFIYGCVTSTDAKGFAADHGCNVMHVYT